MASLDQLHVKLKSSYRVWATSCPRTVLVKGTSKTICLCTGFSEHSARLCATQQGRTPAFWQVLPHLNWRLWGNQRLVQVLVRFIFTGSILFGQSPWQKHLLFLSTGTTDARPTNRHKERAQTLPKFPPRIPTVNPSYHSQCFCFFHWIPPNRDNVNLCYKVSITAPWTKSWLTQNIRK